ncbi:30S ribosomal protein S11 [Candidatus Wolfebacteria bacterium CG03_land_8_20_14_0_80_40_12]|uniref:Small ribosomal subunit protein uS11 n=1 Tax=Candidatus Wolfebacteria bacterium CG03_land_8_20_14_0_80_40_12 TaxID=1975069 RepID=A0A2M7B5P4_9BACT|nr:MAG: 30S ribosomal protein S11 [Candidatus Wolfebacteria bacterium CG03_land_8_20_14_0_80_40_12]
MGKKKIIQKTEEDSLKEKEKSETAILKAASKVAAKKMETGRVYINTSYNNTIFTAADKHGSVIAWSSAGSLGFTGPKKATPFAASKAAAAISEKLRKVGVSNLEIIIKGVSAGRDSAIRSLANQGFNILSIKDVTPIPHNGPKPPKVRRV